MKRTVLLNGQLVGEGKVQLDADDEGLILGLSVFETLRTYERRVFALDDHLDRLAASASAMQIGLPSLDAVAEEIVGASDTIDGESVVRVTLTAGGARIVRAAPVPLVPQPFECVTRCFVPPAWLDGTVKHTSRGYSRMAVRASGVDEVLWVDEAGLMLEGTRSNVFAVKRGVLCTPPVDGRFLAGVTRAFVLEAAGEAGVPVSLQPLPAAEEYQEIYVSSTLKELTGVNKLNGRPAPGAGPIGESVMNAFRDLVRRNLT